MQFTRPALPPRAPPDLPKLQVTGGAARSGPRQGVVPAAASEPGAGEIFLAPPRRSSRRPLVARCPSRPTGGETASPARNGKACSEPPARDRLQAWPRAPVDALGVALRCSLCVSFHSILTLVPMWRSTRAAQVCRSRPHGWPAIASSKNGTNPEELGPILTEYRPILTKYGPSKGLAKLCKKFDQV